MRIFLFLLFAALPAQAQIPLEIRSFEDVSATLTSTEIASRLESLPWKPVTGPVINFGLTHSRVWFRFRIPEEKVVHGHGDPLLLEISNANLDRIGYYEVKGGAIARELHSGMGVPVSAREPNVLSGGWPVFRIPAPRAPDTDYLLSLEGNLPLSLPVGLYEPPEFHFHSWNTMLFLGFFFGMLSLAVIFNGFIGFSLGSRLLYYAAFVLLMELMCAADAGLSIQLFWPETPWWALRELHVIGGITLFCYAQFVRGFVESRRVSPLLDKLLLLAVVASSLRSVLILFWLTQPVIELGLLAVMASNLLVLAIGAQAYRRHVPSAGYFLFASVAFNVGYVLFILQASNVIWLGAFIMHAPQVGISIEVCFLSLALADRIRMGTRELARQKAATVQADKMSALGRMAGEIAHEIANPLAIIHGNAVLIQKEAVPPHVKEFAGVIENTSNRISKIVKGMRALSRDTRRDPFQTVALESIFQDALSLCQERARQRGVKLTVAPLDVGLSVSCRGSEICQVMVNLLNNAFDAVEGQSEPWAKVEAAHKKGVVEISVSDSGPGVAAAIRDRIQEPFFTTKEAGKGLGLGLSISRTIVEHHGGSLWLDEACPRTRFVFSIPASKL